MKNKIFCLLALLFSFQISFSQTVDDAVRYSFLEVGGTARSVGIGGSIGALGADFSVLSTNPAGQAAFRRSEFTFTPTWERSSQEALLDGDGNTISNREKTNFNFNNLGMVFVATRPNSNWTTSAFGLGLNRLANFHDQIIFEGTSAGSITDRWLELSQGARPDELGSFEEGLAYDAEAIYRPDGTASPTFYDNDFDEGELVDKSQFIRRKGSLNELVFTFSGNYQEKLMIGATIGVPFINYEETKEYKETDEADNNPVFDNLTYTERLQTTGAGINLKLGLIYKVNQMVRLGLAFHTPTGYGLSDNFSSTLDYVYTLPDVDPPGEKSSPEGNFEYKLRTPARLIGSAGFIFGKQGFLSAEVEYLDYTTAKFNFNQTTNTEDIEYEQELNDQINNQLASALNIRFGGEYAFDIFRARAGYSIAATPFEQNGKAVGAFSVGGGIRGESVFVDLAYRRSTSDLQYTPYATQNAPEQFVNVDGTRGKFMVTVGIKL